MASPPEKLWTSSPGSLGFIVPHPMQFIIRRDIPFWRNGTFCSSNRFLRRYRSFGTENRYNCALAGLHFGIIVARRAWSLLIRSALRIVALINMVHKLGTLSAKRWIFSHASELAGKFSEQATSDRSSIRIQCLLNRGKNVSKLWK